MKALRALWQRRRHGGDHHDESAKEYNVYEALEANRCPLLPLRLLQLTMTYVTLSDMYAISVVCSRWAEAFDDPHVWEKVLYRDYDCEYVGVEYVPRTILSPPPPADELARDGVKVRAANARQRNFLSRRTDAARSIGHTDPADATTTTTTATPATTREVQQNSVFFDRNARDVYRMLCTRTFVEKRFDEMTRWQQIGVVFGSVVLSPVLFVYNIPTIVRWLAGPVAETVNDVEAFFKEYSDDTAHPPSSVAAERGWFSKVYGGIAAALITPYVAWRVGPKTFTRAAAKKWRTRSRRMELLIGRCREYCRKAIAFYFRQVVVRPLQWTNRTILVPAATATAKFARVCGDILHRGCVAVVQCVQRCYQTAAWYSKYAWGGTCSGSRFVYDTALLPAWGFLQTVARSLWRVAEWCGNALVSAASWIQRHVLVPAWKWLCAAGQATWQGICVVAKTSWKHVVSPLLRFVLEVICDVASRVWHATVKVCVATWLVSFFLYRFVLKPTALTVIAAFYLVYRGVCLSAAYFLTHALVPLAHVVRRVFEAVKFSVGTVVRFVIRCVRAISQFCRDKFILPLVTVLRRCGAAARAAALIVRRWLSAVAVFFRDHVVRPLVQILRRIHESLLKPTWRQLQEGLAAVATALKRNAAMVGRSMALFAKRCKEKGSRVQRRAARMVTSVWARLMRLFLAQKKTK